MKRLKVLVVDDEKSITDICKIYLEREGYEVYISNDGKDALEKLSRIEFDMLILDLMLPHYTGEEITKKVREQSTVPIIMLTAKQSEESKVEGLFIGADDYITKPFSLKELVARVNVIFRRMRDYNNKLNGFDYEDEVLKISFEKMQIYKSGELIVLTANEFKVLKLLIENKGKILSRDKIIEGLFMDLYDGYDRNIDTYIKNIRAKIEKNSREPEYIMTVYGVGYKFSEKN